MQDGETPWPENMMSYILREYYRSGRPKRRWDDNIRMDLREIGWEGVDWIHLAQDRDQWWTLVNTVMNLRIP
jgi:hypothetical protein